MEQTGFPLYRRSSNGLNWYRVDSPTEFMEVQRVGKRYVVHRVEAVIYPEKARVMALIAMDDGHVHACPAQEVEALLSTAE
ncbi:MAG: hypothetical protein JST38_18500 [Bacteroidetes bacterium]|nr:hypothetical protein [Bacteroidota bacterium]MBS1942859.1 hypothetical protein [Bacteroidota bacterium]